MVNGDKFIWNLCYPNNKNYWWKLRKFRLKLQKEKCRQLKIELEKETNVKVRKRKGRKGN